MSQKSEIKIMCIGDSITYGYKMPGSYRKFLYNNLLSKGHKIKMVGAQDQKVEKYYYNKNNPDFFEYDDNNSGFSGYTIRQFGNRKGLFELLHKNNFLKLNPDIIILLIGTNNIMENYDFNSTIKDFISLINFILDNIPKESILFVSTIIDINPNNKNDYTWFNHYRKGKIEDNEVKRIVNDYVRKYNNEIKRIVEDYKNRKYNIRIGDLNPFIKDINKLTFDGVHPNNAGYKIIGEFWTEIIDKYLKEKFNEI